MRVVKQATNEIATGAMTQIGVNTISSLWPQRVAPIDPMGQFKEATESDKTWSALSSYGPVIGALGAAIFLVWVSQKL